MLAGVGLGYLVGNRLVFANREQWPQWVAAVAATVLLSEAIVLASRPLDAPRFGAAGVHAAAAALFLSAARVNRDRPLTLAFSADVPTHVQREGPYRWCGTPSTPATSSRSTE